METVSPSCLLLFQDDSLVCSYKDGSALEVSPCGSTFMHKKAPPSSDHHPLLDLHRRTILQRTLYVTSEYKAKVQQVIGIRNRFASYPYVTSNLLQESNLILKTYADITEVNWSAELDEKYIDVLSNGGIMLRSLDECSSIILASNDLDFSVEYLSKVSDMCKNKKVCDENLSGISGERFHLYDSTASHSDSVGSQIGDCPSETISTRSKHTCSATQHAYVWIIKHMSVKHCPITWQHPLQLVMQFKKKNLANKDTVSAYTAADPTDLSDLNVDDISCHDATSTTIYQRNLENVNEDSLKVKDSTSFCYNGGNQMDDPLKLNDSFFRLRNKTPNINTIYRNSVKMQLPQSLPSKCPKTYLHSWRKISSKLDENVDFDALANSKVNSSLKMMMANGVIYRFSLNPISSEIYPGDGSVITLTDSRGQYFMHTTVNYDGSTTDRMLVASNEAMIPGSHQSMLIRMVKKASRLLDVMLLNTMDPIEICWKTPKAIDREEEWKVFPIEESTVAGLGHFTAYSNGQLKIVFTNRTILTMMAPQLRELPETRNRCTPNEICQIVLPNGQKHNVSIRNPNAEFSSYVSISLEWLERVQMTQSYQQQQWNNTSNSQQADHRLVQTELKKLKCFNYILDNSDIKGNSAETRSSEHENRSDENEKRSNDHETYREKDQIGGRTAICVEHSLNSIHSHPSKIVQSEIHDALHKTSQFISGIDDLLLNK
ncbi:uncharacterized protein C5orf34 homolog isoform X2 [Antedon mediterranea]